MEGQISPLGVMAGLVPAIHGFHHLGMKGGWVYIVTNKPNSILYVGVTSDIARHAYEHRCGLLPGFTKKHGLTRLVWAEQADEIVTAIQRERNMKHWPRAWKVRLILAANPEWDDLYETLV